MSINVTVTGNPVSIKNGKMVTADPNYAKKEFHKRRLLRLEQVRQQSKDIAEDIRNKVRKEKKKQEHEIEEEGRQKLKNWQNRKLLELQTQYREALQELGAGHKEAEALEDEDEIVEERNVQNKKLANDRGRIAASKLQVEKNKTNLKKSIPIQKKKMVRDIENTRAALVSSIKKKKATIGTFNKKKRKKASADISITIPESGSESEETRESGEDEISDGRLSNMDEKQHDTLTSSSTTENSENPRMSLDTHDIATNMPNLDSLDQFDLSGPKPNLNEIEQRTSPVPLAERIRERSRKVISQDTRISDRIKRRDIMTSQIDYCDIVANTNPSAFIKSNTQISEAIESRYTGRGPNGFSNICTCGNNKIQCSHLTDQGPKESSANIGNNQSASHRKFEDSNVYDDPSHRESREPIVQEDPSNYKSRESNLQVDQSHRKPRDLNAHLETLYRRSREANAREGPSHRKFQRDSNTHKEIPTKPPIKLKESDSGGKDVQPSKVTLESNDSHKVQFYDHANRFSQEKFSGSHVEKITSDSLEVLPNVISEAEWHDKMRQRDREAQLRGQRALDKARVQKEYKDIVKKLPLLQKKERISEINMDKPQFHMTEERLKERERQKQNNLDNAYTKLFPNVRPAVVTIPRRRHEADARMSPGDDKPTQSLNVAKWDVDCQEPKMFTIEEVQKIIKAFTGQEPKDRRAKLKELLSSLKLQKEQLLYEIRRLPKDESINELINDLNSVSDSGRTRKRDRTCKRKRCEENEKESSLDSTTESSSSSDLKPHGRRSKITVGKGESGKTPSPRKKPKMKSKRSVLILQNTSTQTTPKPVSPSTLPRQAKPKEPEKLQEGPIRQSPVKICKKLHTPCDCNKENENGTEELCQIVIRINDNEEPEVVVKAKEKEHRIADKTLETKKRSPVVEKVERKIESKSIAIGTDEITMTSAREKVEERRSGTSKVSPSGAIEDSKKKARKIQVTDKGESKTKKSPSEDRVGSKAKSWREQFSKNSLSSASTSYLSPPNFQASINKTVSSRAESSRRSFYYLHKKPQQGNLYDVSGLSVSPSQSAIEERTIDPNLLAYIRKLLSMSRDSVDNLTASTSNVQTPSQSVVEMDSNNPLAQLHNLIKYFNLKAEDIARELSYSPDVSTIHFESTSSVSEKSLRQRRLEQQKGGNLAPIQSPRSDSETPSSTRTAKSTNSIMAQYTNVTDSCTKRIANLASMIQQIREEKIEMLQNPPGVVAENNLGTATSEQDVSTGYLSLPPGSEAESRYSSVDSLDDEEIHRRLLEIDLTLANKLRKFTPLSDEPIIEEKDSGKDVAGLAREAVDKATEELWMRLKRLTEAADNQTEVMPISDSSKDNNQPFVPFLLDIPKLPKLEAQPEEKSHPPTYQRRPPPSKGLTVAKKFNGNISLVPHELSTIAEADSLVSTRISSGGVSPGTSKASQGMTPRKELQVVDEVVRTEQQESETLSSSKSSKSSSNKWPITSVSLGERPWDSSNGRTTETDRSKSSKSQTPSHYSLSMDVNTKSQTSSNMSLGKSMTAVSKKAVLVSSSSSDDLESIEAMLRSIGMDWAIPTLHKTHEALALASSSSSQDVSVKQKSKSSESTSSEISLKEFLSKQVITSKVSSSSLISDASPASISLEFSNLSAIQHNAGENKSKRTSTPITSSASKSKDSLKQVIFSNGSDISSVNPYDNLSFHSLGEQSHSKNSG